MTRSPKFIGPAEADAYNALYRVNATDDWLIPYFKEYQVRPTTTNTGNRHTTRTWSINMPRKSALIVGRGAGLGWALVERFTAAGFDVSAAAQPAALEPGFFLVPHHSIFSEQ